MKNLTTTVYQNINNILTNYVFKPKEKTTTTKKTLLNQKEMAKIDNQQNQENSLEKQAEQIKLIQEAYQNSIIQTVAARKQHLNPMMSISYADQPINISYAKGQYIYQTNGSQVLDCINNVSHVGHCHPYYVMQMQKQLGKLVTNSRFLYDEMMIATNKLLKHFPPELCVVTYVNSGSEANDLAIQMAAIHTKKQKIVCLQGAYHGTTKACTQISPYKWSKLYKKPDHIIVAKSPCTYRGFISESKTPEQDYIKHLQSIIDQNTGCFISELMQSCAGQVIARKQHYKAIYKYLKQKGIVCIGDQVQTGFGRIGQNFWAFEYYDVLPDIVTIGKAMGNGFPVAAVICTREIANSFKDRKMEYFNTYGGNPLAVTATAAVLDIIKWQKLQENALKTGKYLRQRLQNEILPYAEVGDVRGLGLFQGIDIVKSKQSKQQDGERAKKIILKMRARGILVSRDGVHGNILKIKPPMVFNCQNVDHLINNLKQVMAQVLQQESEQIAQKNFK